MSNSGDERFVPWLEQAAQHSDSIVREHAAWALARLRRQVTQHGPWPPALDCKPNFFAHRYAARFRSSRGLFAPIHME